MHGDDIINGHTADIFGWLIGLLQARLEAWNRLEPAIGLFLLEMPAYWLGDGMMWLDDHSYRHRANGFWDKADSWRGNWSWRSQEMEENDWRSELSTEWRQGVVNDLVEAVKQTVKPSLLEATLPSIQKLAVKFEEKVYSLAKDKRSYQSRIATKYREIKRSSNATVSSPSSTSSFSTEIPSDPEAQNSQFQVHKQDQSFTIHHTGLANQHQAAQQNLQMNFENKVTSAPEMLGLANLPFTRPTDCGLTQAPKPNVSLNRSLKDSPGGRLHLPQAIAQQNPEEFPNFQQCSCPELQSSTLSMVKRDPQTVPTQQQQTPKAPSALYNPPSMVEQPKGQKPVVSDARQNQLIAQESSVPDLQHHQQTNLPCTRNDFQSLQSWSQTPEQKLLSQSQPSTVQRILNLSQQDKEQRSQTSGTIKSTSVMEQEEAYQQAESSRSRYIVELREMTQRAINLLQQHDSHQDAKLKLGQAMKYLVDPNCNKSTEKLDLIKKQINCVFQSTMPRKPAASLLHRQLTPNLYASQKSLQPLPQIPRAIIPEDQQKPPSQSMNPQSSAITLQNSNTTNLGDDPMQHSSEPKQQVFMGFGQPPLSTLQQPNGNDLLSQNHRNEQGVKVNSRRSSSVAQPMPPRQKKPLHHAPAHKKRQESQQRQMQQQLIRGNQEVPKQLQQDHEMPFQFGEVNDVNMTQGIEHETSLHQRPEVNNLKFRQATAVQSGVPQRESVSQHQHLKTGVPFEFQAAPVQLPQHPPLTNQYKLLLSHTKVGSSSHSVNSLPGFSANFVSNDSSYLNTGKTEHEPVTDVVESITHFATGTADIAASPSTKYVKMQIAVVLVLQPSILENQVNSISSKALSASVSEIGAVVNLADDMAGAAPVHGSKGSVREDFGATSKTNPLSKYFSMDCDTFGVRKMNRSTNAVPLNEKTTACQRKTDSGSTTFCHIKNPKVQVTRRTLLKEIEEINQQLIDTVIDISDDQTDSTAVRTHCGGIVIKCSFIAVSISPNLSSKEDYTQIKKIPPLQLLIPNNYPYRSPIVLERLPGEVREKHEDFSVKARVKLNLHLRNLLQPMSIGEIARTWDSCVRGVITEYAVKNGGGNIFSKYGTWENCFCTP
ncbi:unnamed protein product [Dovyalis caffra]|uniref:Mediator complex subunit 15 KIX domain-containing protein n=1 Tax=Dovyalis caffra TaxID=77055 RepID=A0AAV1RMI4_9ROSI|nr:unnamed protein product [Dovyalis caffra]